MEKEIEKLAEPSELHVDAVLTNYSQQYKNMALIAMDVLPIVPVKKRSDKFFVYDKDQRFTLPDTKIGPKSTAGEIDLEVSTDNYSVDDFALQEFVSRAEQENADNPIDPERDAVDLLMELIMLDMEKRVADLVFAQATYPASNRVQLSGTDQWSDTANSDPIGDVMNALDGTFMRPNIMVMGNDAWTSFRQHPKIIDAVKGATRLQTSQGGIASRDDVATLFELDAVLVGRSRRNTAKKGQTASFSRLWGKHAALLHVRKALAPRTITFGCVFQELRPMVMRWDAPHRGVKGGTVIKVAMNSDEKIKASDLGFFIEDATA